MYHWWETRIPSDICAGKHTSLRNVYGKHFTRETRIPMIPYILITRTPLSRRKHELLIGGGCAIIGLSSA